MTRVQIKSLASHTPKIPTGALKNSEASVPLGFAFSPQELFDSLQEVHRLDLRGTTGLQVGHYVGRLKRAISINRTNDVDAKFFDSEKMAPGIVRVDSCPRGWLLDGIIERPDDELGPGFVTLDGLVHKDVRAAGVIYLALDKGFSPEEWDQNGIVGYEIMAQLTPKIVSPADIQTVL